MLSPNRSGRPMEAGRSRAPALTSHSQKVLSSMVDDKPRQQPKTSFPNFSQWPENLAVCYTRLMGLLVECGSTADIKKAALLGASNPRLFSNDRLQYRSIGCWNAALLDLLFFEDGTQFVSTFLCFCSCHMKLYYGPLVIFSRF